MVNYTFEQTKEDKDVVIDDKAITSRLLLNAFNDSSESPFLNRLTVETILEQVYNLDSRTLYDPFNPICMNGRQAKLKDDGAIVIENLIVVFDDDGQVDKEKSSLK